MTSLAEAYDRRAGEVSRRRLYLGTGTFLGGALLVVCGILFGATTVLSGLGFSLAESREIAGVCAGLGIPAVFVGVFAVLPANATQRAAAAVGAGVAVLGVMLFRYVYPGGWYDPSGVPTTLTLVVVLLYFAGTITTFWCLFAAAATFKRRNDPGGTVSLTYEEGGETRTVRVAAEDAAAARKALGGGGVGLFGDLDDPDNEPEPVQASRDASRTTRPGVAAGPASDGGTTTDDITSPLDDGEVMRSSEPESPGPVDRYCGNCAHFRHVRTERGIRPYCERHDEVMDDMEACSEWASNN